MNDRAMRVASARPSIGRREALEVWPRSRPSPRRASWRSIRSASRRSAIAFSTAGSRNPNPAFRAVLTQLATCAAVIGNCDGVLAPPGTLEPAYTCVPVPDHAAIWQNPGWAG